MVSLASKKKNMFKESDDTRSAVTSASRKSVKSENYVVRVTILGLTGIMVNRKRCREANEASSKGDGEKNKSKDKKAFKLQAPQYYFPAKPNQMKAVVALSFNSTMKGISPLSKHLMVSSSTSLSHEEVK